MLDTHRCQCIIGSRRVWLTSELLLLLSFFFFLPFFFISLPSGHYFCFSFSHLFSFCFSSIADCTKHTHTQVITVVCKTVPLCLMNKCVVNHEWLISQVTCLSFPWQRAVEADGCLVDHHVEFAPAHYALLALWIKAIYTASILKTLSSSHGKDFGGWDRANCPNTDADIWN